MPNPRNKTKHPDTETPKPSKSDKEIAVMRKNLIQEGLERREARVKENQKQVESQDNGPHIRDDWADLRNQVKEIIPQSRIDRLEEGGHTPMPTRDYSEVDLRGFLNERAGIQEVELTNENLETITRESLQTMENLEKSADLRTHLIKRLRARLNGNTSSHKEEDSDDQGEPR